MTSEQKLDIPHLDVGWHKISSDIHHKLPYITSSQIKLYAQSPQKYYHRYVAKDWPVEPYKKSFLIGTCVHMLLLESFEAHGRVLTCEHDSKTVKFKKWLLESVNGLNLEDPRNGAGRYFDKAGKEYFVLDLEERSQVQAMVRSAEIHPMYAKLVRLCEPEITGVGMDDVGDMYACRGDLRGVLPNGEGFFIDIKTIESISEYGITQQLFNLGYYLQAIHYLRVANMIEPGKYKYFYFFFMEKQFPYECAMVHLNISEDDNRKLMKSYYDALIGIKTSYARDKWGSFDNGKCVAIKPPNWFMSKL